MDLYLHAKCQVSSIILTGFRQEGGRGGEGSNLAPLPPSQNEPLKSPHRLGLALFKKVGGSKKAPTTWFSSVTSTNVGVSPKTFWLLASTLLLHWCKISRPYLVPVPNHWTWIKTTLQNKLFFWSNPYEIEVAKTSVTEMLWVMVLWVTWPNLQYNLIHVIKFCWWHHRQKVWRHNFYSKIPLL